MRSRRRELFVGARSWRREADTRATRDFAMAASEVTAMPSSTSDDSGDGGAGTAQGTPLGQDRGGRAVSVCSFGAHTDTALLTASRVTQTGLQFEGADGESWAAPDQTLAVTAAERGPKKETC